MPVKVSVVVPVYNTEQFLPRCLDSLVSQTLDEIEILVINDGSPDHAQAVIDSYAGRYPSKIRSFTKENGGLSEARNDGLRYASGEFIGFVDSDDFVLPDMFEKLYRRATETDAEVVCCSFFRIEGQTAAEELLTKREDLFGKSARALPEVLKVVRPFAWNKLYRRDFWLRGGYQFPGRQCYEDIAVIYGILLQANKIEYVAAPLYCYRAGREGAITNSYDRRVFDAFKSCSDVIASFQPVIGEQGALPDLEDVMTHICLVHIYWLLYELIQHGGSRLASEYADAAFDFLRERLPAWKESSFLRYDRRRPLRCAALFLCKHRFWVKACCGLPLCLRRVVPNYLDRHRRIKDRNLPKV